MRAVPMAEGWRVFYDAVALACGGGLVILAWGLTLIAVAALWFWMTAPEAPAWPARGTDLLPPEG